MALPCFTFRMTRMTVCGNFFCGGEHSEDEARIVSLRYIYELDHSVGLLKDMPCGSYAERESPTGEWIVNG